MKTFFTCLMAVLAFSITSNAQIISAANVSMRSLTSYTNGMENDSLYFICSSQQATLTATPPGGVAGWNFIWEQFSAPGNTWAPLSTNTGVPVGTLSGAIQGGYRVTVIDGNGEQVGSDIVWICKVSINPSVNITNIPDGCGDVHLVGQINAGTISTYYNPPTEISNPDSALIVASGTQISVCFTGIHTWISDLGFYLVGPPSCGSPVILLSPNPGANGQGNICNSADNFTNLCFSSSSTAIFNPCAPGTYSGTYGGYGVGAGTMINWAGLNGCDASQSGWAVQVYDCVGGDVGSLTGASVTVSGTSEGGFPVTYSYSSPSGFSSSINDNSCNASTASIFVVPASPAVSVGFPVSYEWTANPPFDIPNNTGSLNITLSPGPTVDTQFTLSITGAHPGVICNGTSTATKTFHYLEPGAAVITSPATTFCLTDAAVNLSASASGGTWSGTGITNSTAGTFNPATAGYGEHVITYTVPGGCVEPGTITLNVIGGGVASIMPVSAMCNNASPVTLSAIPGGGTWSGDGITNAQNGVFDPSVAGPGEHTIQYTVQGTCASQGEISIVVSEFIQPEITAPNPSIVCIGDQPIQLTATPSGGTWAGSGVGSGGLFTPASAGGGSHIIYYSVPGNCPQIDSVNITVSTNTTVSVQQVDPLCTNSSAITLTASAPGGVWSGNGITNGTTGTFNPGVAGPGTHTINYVITEGCPAQASISIQVNQFIQPAITAPAALCVNAEPIALSATPEGGSWGGNGVNASGVFDPSVTGSGNANITYSVGGLCPGNTTATIVVNPVPTVSVSPNVSICPGSSTTLSASGAGQYSWLPATGLSSANSSSPSASPSSTTVYTVTGTTAGCSGSAQVTVTVYPPANVQVNGPFLICPGDEVQLVASGLASYSWNNSQTLSSPSISNPLASPFATTTYTVSGADANGCQGSANIEVVIMNVGFTLNPQEGTSPLEVEFFNHSEGNNFEWDFDNGSSYSTADASEVVTSIYNVSGTYVVTLTATSGGVNCSVSHNVFVYSDSRLAMPNIVTPNGDGKNDTFRVDNDGMKSLNIVIFDRWGRQVGTIDTPTGSWNPRDFEDGIYYFTLEAEGFDGKTFSEMGYFHVMR